MTKKQILNKTIIMKPLNELTIALAYAVIMVFPF